MAAQERWHTNDGHCATQGCLGPFGRALWARRSVEKHERPKLIGWILWENSQVAM